jgi:hypothetical protein
MDVIDEPRSGTENMPSAEGRSRGVPTLLRNCIVPAGISGGPLRVLGSFSFSFPSPWGNLSPSLPSCFRSVLQDTYSLSQ